MQHSIASYPTLTERPGASAPSPCQAAQSIADDLAMQLHANERSELSSLRREIVWQETELPELDHFASRIARLN